MNFSELFIRRPVLSTVLSLMILLLGAQGILSMSIRQYPKVDDLHCLYGDFVAQGLMLMDADAADGFVRAWQTAPELQPAKHYGYAAQWFAFTLTLIGIFIKLSFRVAAPTSSSGPAPRTS